MKKHLLAPIRQRAAALPKTQQLSKMYRPEYKKDVKGVLILDLLGQPTLQMTAVPAWFPVNHYRRLKRAFLRDGEAGMQRYERKVAAAKPKASYAKTA